MNRRFPRGWTWGHQLRWLVGLIVLYLAFMVPFILGVLILEEAQPHDLDCLLVGPSELYCRVVVR